MGTLICVVCGAVTTRSGGRQKYCPACRDMRAAYRKRGAKPPEECTIYSLSGKSLARVAAEAKALGLNYGEYSTLVNERCAERWCRDRGINSRQVFAEIRVS